MTRQPFVRAALAAGALVLAVAGGLWTLDAGKARAALRESALDLALSLVPPPAPAERIVVVDIDDATLARFGPWPWSRTLLARLVEALAAGSPAVIGLDMLLEGEDRRSEAAIARRLAAQTGRADLAAIAAELPDGDAELARALARAPVVLGAVFGSAPAGETVPLLARGAPRLPDIWRGEGVAAPVAALAAHAAGVGLIAFENDADGTLRRAPLLALAGGAPLPGFAAEVARVARGASTLILEGPPERLRLGDLSVPLGPDAALRFFATGPEAWRARALSAASVLDGGLAPGAIEGAVALVGSSAPEAGAFRRTAASPAAPSVEIEADAVAGLLSGAAPIRPRWAPNAEIAGALATGLMAAVAGALLAPSLGLAALAGLAILWVAGCMAALRFAGVLIDPAGPPALAALAFAASALAAAAVAERRERRLRDRFEQHLAPQVVARILAAPGALRLAGEAREVTAMFTDIEGFTAMSERAAPRELIALLDAYFQMVCDLVVEHGGMVDKIIGDSAHALFNAPLDLDDHPRRAVECALAVARACAAFRLTPQAKALGLGRTRIGIETGPAIVGDVGGRRKLDYTAHGTAINTAARLEQANKTLGTTICVGPEAAARLPAGLLRWTGRLPIRGRSAPLDLYEPAAPADFKEKAQ
ncbi:CHASE2 domain-containing protein [Methylocella sp.]|uniref:CHASE2 domain-containing protein n=1 Tax=Methylocella sp. TaxID=1978226 RepID=UPI0035AF974B